MALSDPKNRATVIRNWEGFRPGWHEWDWCKKQLKGLIAERERMIAAGEPTATTEDNRKNVYENQ